MRGKYFLLEGEEGCGKDTQLQLLQESFQNKGYDIIVTGEPGGTAESEQIRKVLLGSKNRLDDITELFLYQAARRDIFDKIIVPNLNKGNIILSGRGFPSTHAYQGFGGGVDLDLITRLNKIATFGVEPDLLVIIDIDPVKGLEKETDKNRFSKKTLEYHQRVRQGYLDVAKKFSNFSVVIDYREGDIEGMHKEIMGHINKKLK